VKKTKNVLPDGRHVATVGNDELLMYAAEHVRADVRAVAEAELARRATRTPPTKRRDVKAGYVPFGSGQRGVPNSLNAYNTKPKREDNRKER
jgi:hypothetical protein